MFGFKKASARGQSLGESTADLMQQRLWAKILIGMALGVTVGLLLAPSGAALLDNNLSLAIGEWLALPGVIFLGLIQMVIIPLILCSIILGIAESGSMEFLKQMGSRLVPYFLVTSAIAITIGITLVNITQPGNVMSAEHLSALQSGAANQLGSIPQASFEDLTIPQRIANIIPSNPAKAQLNRDMLQIVVVAIFIGIALITIPKKAGAPFKDLCIAGQMLSMKIINWAMMIAPLAVFGLLANVTIRTGLDSVLSVGVYTATVLAGLLAMLCVYLFILRFIGGYDIGKFIKGIREVQLLAFSTSSSAATMPFSIKAAEETLHLRPEIGRFVIPLGATINMDGTGLYQGVAAIFLCQVFNIDLSLGETILLIITTVGASIGTPATPGVGLVVLATILTGIGVPVEGLALILGVDRILDMCRTTVNVTGDLTASVIMNKWVKNG